ncbi:uncharacterized protein [Arachis hypogaea]|uniref:uncharacterized protein n=1 Tax=Arachis hypogaea TaxID=3818 RepID=UPI003B21A5FD
MLEAFPGCTLTAKHCKNKHKQLKEKYQYAADMLGCSGFDWNHEKQCVEVDSKDVLDAWLKAHPTKFYSPGKPFPFFFTGWGVYLAGIEPQEQQQLVVLMWRNRLTKRQKTLQLDLMSLICLCIQTMAEDQQCKDKHHNLKQVRVKQAQGDMGERENNLTYWRG